jgi:sRNA-binding carbon storage regulator CsrA
MAFATYHEGEAIQVEPGLAVVVLSVGDGKVKLGLSAFPVPGVRHNHHAHRLAPSGESRSATLAVLRLDPAEGARPQGPELDEALRAESVSCRLQDGFFLVRGRAASYYWSRPGLPPMLVIRCGENQRIRINEEIEIVVLDIHDSRVVRGLPCPSAIQYTARRLADRLRVARGLPLDLLPPQSAFAM